LLGAGREETGRSTLACSSRTPFVELAVAGTAAMISGSIAGLDVSSFKWTMPESPVWFDPAGAFGGDDGNIGAGAGVRLRTDDGGGVGTAAGASSGGGRKDFWAATRAISANELRFGGTSGIESLNQLLL
jgi:hypothetical protein